jgi:hypothetical protein
VTADLFQDLYLVNARPQIRPWNAFLFSFGILFADRPFALMVGCALSLSPGVHGFARCRHVRPLRKLHDAERATGTQPERWNLECVFYSD